MASAAPTTAILSHRSAAHRHARPCRLLSILMCCKCHHIRISCKRLASSYTCPVYCTRHRQRSSIYLQVYKHAYEHGFERIASSTRRSAEHGPGRGARRARQQNKTNSNLINDERGSDSQTYTIRETPSGVIDSSGWQKNRDERRRAKCLVNDVPKFCG
eukprot:2592655-Pleurochrysis_carterae.AAC.1